MASPNQSSSSNTQQPTTYAWRIQKIPSATSASSPKSVNQNGNLASSSTSAISRPQPVSKATPLPSAENAVPESVEPKRAPSRRKRRRVLDEEERAMRDEIAASVAHNLALDQIMTAFPDADEPFADKRDVVDRLLPYHIYQHPQKDLDTMHSRKGKGKATEADMLRGELHDTKFAIECHERFEKIQSRIRKGRMQPGKHASPLDQQIVLERFALEAERIETTAAEQELSAARAELDKLTRAQRQAKAAAAKASQTNSTQPTSSINSSTSFQGSNVFRPYTNPAFTSTPAPNFSNYYSTINFPLNASMFPGVSFMPSKNQPAQKAATGTFATPVAATHSTASTSTSTLGVRPPPVAIPLQLPVSALPILQSLGILPVPKASLPPPSEPQPAAVLLGSANNLLSLEINAGLLQAPQMSGLAMLLSNLVKFSGSNTNGAVGGDNKAGAGGEGSGKTVSAATIANGASGSKAKVNGTSK